MKLSRYSLLHEPWIEVVDKNNQQEKVSMLDLFANSHKFWGLSGETAPQDFAILRLLLSVLHTTFSRYKIDGSKQEKTKKAMQQTWQRLWKLGQFPKIVSKYLISQEDKFYLYDDKYPFMQVTKQDLDDLKITKTGTISGKLINRLISESNNKVALFSPTADKYKNRLSDDQLARWLVAMQGYTGTSDKAKFPGMKELKIAASRGWLLSIGGVFLQGENLFQTLLLNLKLDDYKEQHPVWEKSLEQKTDIGEISHPKDLADIYTNESRLIYINPETNLDEQHLELEAVQLPAISDEAQYIEPMTLWQRPKSGKHKGEDIPKTHRLGESLWRSFSALSIVNDDEKESIRNTGIISWYDSDTVDDMIDIKSIKVCAVGMPYNHDASGMPNGEFYDEVNINPQILFDNVPKGWNSRIADQVELTKTTIYMSTKLAEFICEVRNTTKDMSKSFEEELYFSVDEPFKSWIAGIDESTDKNDYILHWRKKLYGILQRKSKDLITPITARDLRGKVNENTGRVENSIVAYQQTMIGIKNKLN